MEGHLVMEEHLIVNRDRWTLPRPLQLEAQVHRMLVCSTAHISEETNLMLDKGADQIGPVSYFPLEHGYLIWTGSEGIEDQASTEWADVPRELRDLMIRARHANIDWIRLDCDAPPIEGIPTYEW